MRPIEHAMAERPICMPRHDRQRADCAGRRRGGAVVVPRITSYNVCYTKLLRNPVISGDTEGVAEKCGKQEIWQDILLQEDYLFSNCWLELSLKYLYHNQLLSLSFKSIDYYL